MCGDFSTHECELGVLRGYFCFTSSKLIINIQLQQMFALFAHVDQPKGLSELFVPHLSICHTVFYLSELYVYVLPSLQHLAHC